MSESVVLEGAVCPVPVRKRGKVILGHGSGGKLTHDLINDLFLPALESPALLAGNDAAVVPELGFRLAVSTDSHVVDPLFFPGGDIGRLAVCGTVNDVAMMGAQPLYLTAGFILEEGLELSLLEQVVDSMRIAAEEAGVQIIAGDTKVVERGKADGLYINTSGIGRLADNVTVSGDMAQPGDVIILSGPVGDHGIAVLEARGDLGFESNILSDVAPLNHLVASLLAISQIRVLRDPTRGGIASALNEISRQSKVGILLNETDIPVRPAVQAACEMLGFDPLYIANEGKLLAVVPAKDAGKVLECMRSFTVSREAVVIGEVSSEPPGRVLLKTAIGGTRIVDMLAGEILPRIC